MSGLSSIEWTDATWNPTRGCTRVSEGCRNCYAERQAVRHAGPGRPYEGLAKSTAAGPRWTGEVRLVPELLDWPLRRHGALEAIREREGRNPRVFVNSMSDLFHEGLTFEEIAAVFGVMAAAPGLTFQVLTKRPQLALEFFLAMELRPGMVSDASVRGCNLALARLWRAGDQPSAVLAGIRRVEADRPPWPLPNVQLGVSAEDQPTADERIQLLLHLPAAVRFVSYEPALGPVDFTRIGRDRGEDLSAFDHVIGLGYERPPLDWVIVGGESGPDARPFDVAWARETVRQSRAAGVACFVKQLGAKPHEPYGETPSMWGAGVGIDPAPGCPAGPRYWARLRDRRGGDWSEWPEDLRVREFPAMAPALAAMGA